MKRLPRGLAAFCAALLLATVVANGFFPAQAQLPKTALARPSPGKWCKPDQPEGLLPSPTAIHTPPPTSQPVPTARPIRLDPAQLSFRAGFGMSALTQPEAWAERLHSGWFLSWRVLPRPASELPEHWQMVHLGPGCVYPSIAYLSWTAAQYPGNVWIIGNEPDVVWQDDLKPEEYALVYHDLYQAIKSADPTAKIAAGGISQATPLRLAYLDRVLQAYRQRYSEPMPADWWTVHGYVLREEHDSWGVDIPPGFTRLQGELREVSDHGRLDLFEEQIMAFRQWMAQNGYRDTPLALTEFGILMPPEYGFPPQTLAAYLQESFAWLLRARDGATGYPRDDNRLVQRWAWFSLADTRYPAPNLANLASDSLTPLGVDFRDTVLKEKP